jgi:hypothetical protein
MEYVYYTLKTNINSLQQPSRFSAKKYEYYHFLPNTLKNTVLKSLIDDRVIFLIIYITVEQFSLKAFHLLTDTSITIRIISPYIFINFCLIYVSTLYLLTFRHKVSYFRIISE